jgi:hypothetical protein
MNARLKKVKDGAGNMNRNEVVWFDVACSYDPTLRKQESGEIYCPFALVWQVAATDNLWSVMHLPSGYYVVERLPRTVARRAITQLRRLAPLDAWEFTKPKGRKWQAIKTAAGPLVKRLRHQEAK